MDFLASLHLDELPEQQTRAAHLSKALSKDAHLKLGFNCCCSCGKITDKLVVCPHCLRISYCSEACRIEDTRPPLDEDEGAMGHSSIICSLLRLCSEDEEVQEGSDSAAANRVRSELESYPATLANVLREGPCYHEYLSQIGSSLNIHVIGASLDGELWNGHVDTVIASYTEALLQIAEDFGFNGISLHMIGPECPTIPLDLEQTLPYERDMSKTYTLHLTTHQGLYTDGLLREISKPHVVCFFNPGFTCPDYDWGETMELLDYGTAYLSTTNTEMEGVSDCNYLMEKRLFPHLPPLAAEIMGIEDYGNLTFFLENPYSGSRVRQSGTMANDVFVKNRWMLGGMLAKPEKKRTHAREKEELEDEPGESPTNKMTKGNTKALNPALI
jgi:hypothetical protein